MEWIELKSQRHIDKFMDEFYEFHDSCIKECSYITGMSIDKNEQCINQDINGSSIKFIFESQLCNPIEIYFEGIKEANIYTYDKQKYFNSISEAMFFIENDLIYWVNSLEWNKDSINKEVTYVVCQKAKYRNIY